MYLNPINDYHVAGGWQMAFQKYWIKKRYNEFYYTRHYLCNKHAKKLNVHDRIVFNTINTWFTRK